MRLQPVAVLALLCASVAAHADSMFTLSGTFASGATLSGTVTALTNGSPLTLDATVTNGQGAMDFNVTGGLGLTADSFLFGLTTPASASTEGLYLYFPQRTLFSGEALCSSAVPCPGTSDFTRIVSLSTYATLDSLVSGQIVAVAATPEPSSFALLGTGLLGVAGAVRRRLVSKLRATPRTMFCL